MTGRLARLSGALFLASPLVAASATAQGVEYPSGTTRYRISTTTRAEQASPMGNATIEASVEQQLTVNLMKHAKDTLMATITLDSLAVKSSGPTPDVSKLVGLRFVTMTSPTGKLYSSKSPDGIPAELAQLTEGVTRFLPSYSAKLAPGVTWADTTSGKITQQGMDMDRTVVSTYKVEGDTTISGEKAYRVNRMTAAKATGTGSMQGTPVAMETTQNSNGALFITPRGAFVGGTSADDVTIKISVIAQNMEINIRQTGQTRIEAIR